MALRVTVQGFREEGVPMVLGLRFEGVTRVKVVAIEKMMGRSSGASLTMRWERSVE